MAFRADFGDYRGVPILTFLRRPSHVDDIHDTDYMKKNERCYQHLALFIYGSYENSEIREISAMVS